MSTSLVIGNMVGAGVFMMPAALAAYGGISIMGWLASSLGTFVLALVFSKLSKLFLDKSGGPYAYTRAGFGEFAGFLVAWGYWISTWIGIAVIAIGFVSALSILFPILGNNSLISVLTGLSAIWLLTWINTRGVRESGKIQVVTTILKLTPILMIIIGGFFFFNIDNFIPFNVSDSSSFEAIAITSTMTLYAFLGFESATIPSDNVKNPGKTIPKATILGTLITTMVYVLGTAAVMGMVPMKELEISPAPFADAMGIMTGELGRGLVAGGAAIAAFGALNGWILIVGQMPKAIAKDKLFPGIFKKENKKGIPVYGMIIGSALASIVMLMNYTEGLVEQFRFLILLGTMIAVVPYLFSAASYVSILLEKKLPSQPWLGIYGMGSLAFSYSLWALFGAGEESVFWGFIMLMIGIPFYVFVKWKNKDQT
ncbi:amino acid permease [Lentiprolixibacter aurantiacus]|uniref:Arginine/agmatine antiporter n=1 Tax=Lentiprolixibacter aurantiacus TaxID=2993939 RepID=A0AAE3MK73_9FLAO|nr:amino acid permease [Lentiprolixibacter aurantiacus]MCX2718933.1 amino acid permease [Lentiprolixibacter aurantiacus]